MWETLKDSISVKDVNINDLAIQCVDFVTGRIMQGNFGECLENQDLNRKAN